MKISKNKLLSIIKEELRSVLGEAMIDPTNPIERALKDPQVDEKIKNLLRMDDPELRKQGVELLSQLYPNDYSMEDGEGYQGSEQYEKDFEGEMKTYKDIAKLRGIIEFIYKLPGNIEVSFLEGKMELSSESEEYLFDAIYALKKEYGGRFPYLRARDLHQPPKIEKNPFVDEFTTTININTSYYASLQASVLEKR